MLHREIMAVCCEIHTKHINAVCGQNVEFCNVHTADVRCSGLLHSEYWSFLTDVLGQPTGPIFMGSGCFYF